MSREKTATITIRIAPGLKEALRLAAAMEHRSVTNMVEVLVRSHCESNGISISEGPGPTRQSETGAQ